MKTIVVTTLALYQTKFWVELANQMVGPELGMAFISFDERSSQLIKKIITVFLRSTELIIKI